MAGGKVFCWDSLPHEVQIHILSKVPLLEIGKLELVSKLWFNLITKDRYFGLSNLAEQDGSGFCSFGVLLGRCIFYKFDSEWKTKYINHYLEFQIGVDGSSATCRQHFNLSFQSVPGVSNKDETVVRCCCDGVVFFTAAHRGKSPKLFLCNPITGSSSMLPPIPKYNDNSNEHNKFHTSWGMCHDRLNNTLQVVGLRCTRGFPCLAHIVSCTVGKIPVQLSSSAWKELQIEDGCVWHKDIQSVVTNNTFNWICERNNGTGLACLFSFHLYEEKVVTKPLNVPRWPAQRSTSLLASREFLYFMLLPQFGDDVFVEIWVMKDWNSMEWAKERMILIQSLWSFVPKISAFNYFPMKISPLGFTTDGRKLLLRLDGYGKLISYDLDSQSLAEVRFEVWNEILRSYVHGRKQPGERSWWRRRVSDHIDANVHFNSLVNWVN